MRTLNKQLLRHYLVIQGELAKETLAIESKISFEKIGRLLRGVKTATELEMDSLCRVTGHSIDELFPLCDQAKKKESA